MVLSIFIQDALRLLNLSTLLCNVTVPNLALLRLLMSPVEFFRRGKFIISLDELFFFVVNIVPEKSTRIRRIPYSLKMACQLSP